MTPEPTNHLEALLEAMAREPTGTWLNADELAQLLKTRIGHIHNLVAAGNIPYVKLGWLVRFHRPTIENWLSESCSKKAKEGGYKTDVGTANVERGSSEHAARPSQGLVVT
jgi:excisionase family DNA binding protein